MKPNSHKFENKVALAAWIVIMIVAVLDWILHMEWASGILGFVIFCFLTWRWILWELRKKSEWKRIGAWWERPTSHDDFHIVRDVMDS
jgi:Flp pilus assembly protein TadB